MADRRLTRYLIDTLEPDKFIREVCDTELHGACAETRAKNGNVTQDLGAGLSWRFS